MYFTNFDFKLLQVPGVNAPNRYNNDPRNISPNNQTLKNRFTQENNFGQYPEPNKILTVKLTGRKRNEEESRYSQSPGRYSAEKNQSMLGSKPFSVTNTNEKTYKIDEKFNSKPSSKNHQFLVIKDLDENMNVISQSSYNDDGQGSNVNISQSYGYSRSESKNPELIYSNKKPTIKNRLINKSNTYKNILVINLVRFRRKNIQKKFSMFFKNELYFKNL